MSYIFSQSKSKFRRFILFIEKQTRFIHKFPSHEIKSLFDQPFDENHELKLKINRQSKLVKSKTSDIITGFP